MKILTDIHTHTNVSPHAYSTLYENMCTARDKGIELVAMTNHGPSMPDSPHLWHFLYYKALPRKIEGVKLLCGVEANIINHCGKLDLQEKVLKNMELVIASIHADTYNEKKGGDHTETWLNVMNNPNVDVLGHCGSPDFLFDIDTVVSYAKKKNVCIEINNHSFLSRPQNIERCREIAIACKKHGTYVVVNSDAHFMGEIGMVSQAVKMLKEVDFPEQLVVNLSAERFIKYISEKKNRNFEFNEFA